MKLLDLPPELFELVITEYVRSNGCYAWYSRGVCSKCTLPQRYIHLFRLLLETFSKYICRELFEKPNDIFDSTKNTPVLRGLLLGMNLAVILKTQVIHSKRQGAYSDADGNKCGSLFQTLYISFYQNRTCGYGVSARVHRALMFSYLGQPSLPATDDSQRYRSWY